MTTKHTLKPGNYFLLIFAFLPFCSDAQFWGAKKARPFDTPKDSLKKGEYTWAPELAPRGPIVVSVSLDEQLAYTYRNGVLIGIATTSTGKKGHETPTGVFVTLLKDAKHRSSKYNNAAMPFTQRLTNDGISLHAGGLPGYPSSHGCVHLPSEYARQLFKESPLGMTVIITNKTKFPEALNHPSFLSQINSDGTVQEHERLSTTEKYRWKPELAPDGPVSILVSRNDKRMVVLRNGIEIGRCKVNFVNENDSLGTVLYQAHVQENIMIKGKDTTVQKTYKWASYPLTDFYYGNQQHGNLEDQLARMKPPVAFIAKLADIIAEGSTMMITDAEILRKTTGIKMNIVSSHPGK